MSFDAFDFGILARPPQTLVYQLILSSVAIGFTRPGSSTRAAVLPILVPLVYSNIVYAAPYLRPRWTELHAMVSLALLLQYFDVALLSRMQYESAENRITMASALNRFWYGWKKLWAWRHLNTKHESNNSPYFHQQQPACAPSRRSFLLRRTVVAIVCYLILDIIENQPIDPAAAATLFNSDLIPIFRRWHTVTLEQFQFRILAVTMFAITYFNIIHCFYSATSAVSVALHISNQQDWRPCFGPFLEGYTLKNAWGKVWHQFLRHFLSQPAKTLVYSVFKMTRGSLLPHTLAVLLTFLFSGILHLAANVSLHPDIPWQDLGPVIFFATQGIGVLVEQSFLVLVGANRGGKEPRKKPSILLRLLGYIWVIAFLAWSGPVWIYPQISGKPVDGNFFLPFSMVRKLRNDQ